MLIPRCNCLISYLIVLIMNTYSRKQCRFRYILITSVRLLYLSLVFNDGLIELIHNASKVVNRITNHTEPANMQTCDYKHVKANSTTNM